MPKAKKPKEKDVRDMIGVELEISEVCKRALSSFDGESLRAQTLMKMGADLYRETKDRFWEVIRNFYPETEPYHLHYDGSRSVIMLISKRTDGEEKKGGRYGRI